MSAKNLPSLVEMTGSGESFEASFAKSLTMSFSDNSPASS